MAKTTKPSKMPAAADMSPHYQIDRADLVRRALRLYASTVEQAIGLAASVGEDTEPLVGRYSVALDMAREVSLNSDGIWIRVNS